MGEKWIIQQMILGHMDNHSEKSEVGALNHTLFHNKSELSVKKQKQKNYSTRRKHSWNGVGLRMLQNPEVIKCKIDKFDDIKRKTFTWEK